VLEYQVSGYSGGTVISRAMHAFPRFLSGWVGIASFQPAVSKSYSSLISESISLRFASCVEKGDVIAEKEE
jgi:hypothetical protein